MKTDTQLQTDIMEELKFEPSINAAQIGVAVKDGIVTLSGQVHNYSEKMDTERAALRVSGVKALVIEIEISLLDISKRTDADIARAAENILEWSTFLPNNSVKLIVEDGWISLSGAVDWQYQREASVDSIRHLMGVTGVINDITIKSRVNSSVVKSAIEAALKRRASCETQEIIVNVQGDEVVLSGKVHNWSERDLAIHSAWCVSGVRNVEDKMTFA